MLPIASKTLRRLAGSPPNSGLGSLARNIGRGCRQFSGVAGLVKQVRDGLRRDPEIGDRRIAVVERRRRQHTANLVTFIDERRTRAAAIADERSHHESGLPVAPHIAQHEPARLAKRASWVTGRNDRFLDTRVFRCDLQAGCLKHVDFDERQIGALGVSKKDVDYVMLPAPPLDVHRRRVVVSGVRCGKDPAIGRNQRAGSLFIGFENLDDAVVSRGEGGARGDGWGHVGLAGHRPTGGNDQQYEQVFSKGADQCGLPGV